MTEVLARFSVIREEGEFSRKKLPESRSPIVQQDADLETLFHLALQNWEASFDKDFFLHKLAEYINTKPKQRLDDQELKKYLKTVRKACLILRSAQHFFSDGQFLPDNIIFFTRYLGKANDAYGMKIGKKYAKRVVAILQKGELDFSGFTRGSVQDYEARIAVFINRARELLARKKISIPDYHRLRKDLRHFMNLYQIVAAKDPSNLLNIQIFQYLNDLNSDLGHIHDEYVAQELRNQIDYDNGQLKIPKSLRERLENFYDFLES